MTRATILRAFGYPAEPAARVALETVLSLAPSLESVERIRFVKYDDASLDVHRRILADLG
jgi:O-acetyl-ADP-ribose deacetylase